MMHRYRFFTTDLINLRPEMADTDTLPHRHFSQETASDLSLLNSFANPINCSLLVLWLSITRKDKFMASMNLISWLTSVSTVLIMLVAGFF